MRRALAVICLVGFCTVSLLACGRGGRPNVEKAAQAFLDYWVVEDFSAASKCLEAGLAKRMPPQKMKQSWTTLTNAIGPFQKQTARRTAREEGADIVYITCQFEQRTMDLKLTFNTAGKITRVLFVPPGKKPATRPSKRA